MPANPAKPAEMFFYGAALVWSGAPCRSIHKGQGAQLRGPFPGGDAEECGDGCNFVTLIENVVTLTNVLLRLAFWR